ncbi:MAG: hypothetical protein J3R72DRAFT_438530 [Linnemannia gamsii]|nr:MAG: hypothetical protein J3R72DRAFT_438530 [Linnemannia gamsii]
MFTTSAVILPNMLFEELAEQIVAVTQALELIKDLQPVVETPDTTSSRSSTSWSNSSTSWSNSSTPKAAPRQPYVSDIPPLPANQHPIVLSLWVNSSSLMGYKANLARELMELIREKRKHARSLELGRINKKINEDENKNNQIPQSNNSE